MVSAQGRFLLGKQAVVEFIQFHLMDQSVKDDGVPAVFGVELGEAAALQQFLSLFQGGGQAKAQADRPVPGGHAYTGQDLIQIYLTGPSPLGQGGFGQPAFLQQLLEHIHKIVAYKLLLIHGEKPAQVGSGGQFVLQIVGVFLYHEKPGLSKNENGYV